MVAIITGTGTGLERSSAWVLGSRGQLGSAALGRNNEGVYVNAANGNLVVTRQDEILIGLGPNISIDRTYNSQATPSDGDNDDNWRMGVYRKIVGANGDATVKRIDWDGSETVYTQVSANNYVCKEGAGAYDTLVWSTGTTSWTWTDGSSRAYESYTSTGRLDTFRDADGNGILYSYNGAGLITRVTCATNEYTDLVYGGAGGTQLLRLTTVAPSGSVRVHYTYDGSNRLSTVTVDLSPDDSLFTDNNIYATTYTYDGSSKRVASIAQADGSYVAFTYVLVGADYRVASYTQTVAAGVTRTTSFDYSVAGRTIVTDPAGQKTILFVDANKNLTQISYPPENTNTTPRVVQFAYNANGDVTSATLGPGNVITYSYDGNGNLLAERDSAGNSVSRTYGAKNELLTETRYLVADPDGAGSGQPGTPVTTRYAYDSENHLRYVVSAEGFVTQYEYDAPGRQTAANEYAGNAYNIAGLAENVSIAESTLTAWVSGLDKTSARRTETTYDYRGAVATVKSYSKLLSSGVFDTSSELSQTTYTYDRAGNLLTRVISGSAASEVFAYDGMGRMTQATDFNGNVTRTSFLDARSQTVLTHANGLSEISTYNRGGELIAFSSSSAGGNLVDVAGWPGNPGSVPSGQATVPGWGNWGGHTDETIWAATTGPDGVPVVAIRSGQSDAGYEGGGNATHEVAIDGSKAYEFTYYFKLSDLNEHYIYFGLSGWAATDWVENATTGADEINPYFVSRADTQQGGFTADKWYKVVGYVLPEGAALVPAGSLGGIYDAQTGEKVAGADNVYRWNAGRPSNSVYARFFNFYGDLSHQYSTYFLAPEIRQVSTATVLGHDAATSLYRYDNLGRLRMTVDPTGRRNYMMYDSVGRKVADIDADGSAIEYRYDGSDNLTSTTRYVNKISVSALVDANGNPTNASFASLRPASHAEDQWTFQIYDAANRLIQTIDGTGATSVLTYDGASRVTATKSYANKLDAGTLASLKALANNPNRWNLDANGLPQYRYNLSVAGAGTIDGANAYQLTVGAGTDWQAIWTDGLTLLPGQTISATITVKAVGSVTMDSFGLYGGTSGWGVDADAFATVVSGPGQISYQYGGYFQVSGLSISEASRFTITRTYRTTEWGSPYFYLGNSAIIPGQSTIISAPTFSSTPSSPILPTADAANDRATRNFYDNDGRVIATLDGAGGLNQLVYDKGGRKIRELGAATAANSSLWASGTLAQLISSVGTSASDRRTDYVYDARGFLRYTVDAAAQAVKYVADATGNVIRISAYNGSITPAASYSVDYVLSQLAAAGLDVSATRRVTRAAYDSAGQKMFDIDAAGAVTAYAYDNVGNVIKQTRYATAYSTIDDTPGLATMQAWAAGEAANASNRISRNFYDLRGRLAYTVDAENYVTEHQYDRAGRVAKDIRYAGTYTVSDSVTKASLAAQIGTLPGTAVVVTNAYDADGLLSDVTDGTGAVTHFTYNAFGQVIDTIVAYGTADATTVRRAYDVLGRVISETGAYGTGIASTTGYAYDALGNLVTVTDPRGYATARTYDTLGRVLTVSVPVDGNSANNLVTTNQYDAFGNLAKVSQSAWLGNANSYRYYDSLGRLVLDVDAERFWTRTAYTVFGEVGSVTRGYDRVANEPAVGTQPTTPTNAADAVTSFTYDKMSRLKSVTDAMGNTESYEVNGFGDRWWINNKTGGWTQFVFDRLSRPTCEYVGMTAHGSDGSVQATAYHKYVWAYDSRGNLVSKIEAWARTALYTYDKANRVIQVSHDQIQVIAQDLVTSTTVTPIETYTYNARGELIQSVDVGGGKTLSYYDALGRKTTEVSAVGTLSAWTYDANGNLLTTRVYGDAVSIPGTPGGTPPNPVNAGNYRETTFAHDRANRLTTTTVAALRLGGFNGSTYSTYVEAVVTSREYDKAGNVVVEYDGVGYAVRSYYDALNRKVAQVDREDFLTVWTRDTNGNALSETRYASRVSSPPALTATVAQLIALVGGGNASVDRTTSFTYDKNGRRLTETRASVFASSVSGTGALSSSTQSATITYTYNALGLVTRKTEANGDFTQFEYDTYGRLIRTKAQEFVDNMGVWVMPVTETFYNGLGNVVRTEVNNIGGAAGDDRVTTFSYGAAGRLASTTDAVGFIRIFDYDAAGRLVKERYTRVKADGTTNVTEATGYRYDLAGRLVTQAAAVWNGSAYVFSEATRIRYNPYGEVSGKGLTGGPNDAAVYQETFDYDAGGRMWRSTGGDGTVKLYVHNRNGAVTLAIASAGTDLGSDSIDQAIARLTNNGANTVGAVAVTGVTATILVYNRRGELADTREPFRELSWNGSGFTTQTLTAGRTYNAFGEVLSETDARGYTTDFTYNAMGRLTRKESPSVAWTSESGAVANARPTEDYYYDISGRLVGVRNANSNLTTRALLAGTGFGETEALVSAEFHPDGGVARSWYNVFGDARVLADELGQWEVRGYDNMGRVTVVVQRGGLLTDYYAYDGLGRRTQHWNSLLGSGNVERTDYDVQGRVTGTLAFGGDTITYAYGWDGSYVTGGLGTFGGWVKSTTYSNGRVAGDYSDYFGRTIYRTDLGSHPFSYTFDKGGRLVSENGATTQTHAYSWFNTGLTASVANDAGTSTFYGYDAAGNETSEKTVKSSIVVQDATAAFDALNRMTSWAEAGNGTLTSGSPPASIAYQYDLNGNIRRSNASYRALDAQGVANGAAFTHDNWYRYDNMNRVTVEKGVLSGGQIVGGILYGYDAAGRRAIVTQTVSRSKPLSKYIPSLGNLAPRYYDEHANIIVPDDGDGSWSYVNWTFSATAVETYGYTAAGKLSTVSIAVQDLNPTGDFGTTNPQVGALGASQLRSSHSYDAMGRETHQVDWIGNGTDAAYDRTVTYNAKGQVATETTVSKQIEAGATTPSLFGNETTYYYGSGTGYNLGSIEHSVTTNKKDNVVKASVTTTNSYAWWAGAVQASTNVVTDYVSGTDTNYTTTFTNGNSGQLVSAYIGDGRARTITFTTNTAGEIIRRDEADGNGGAGDPHEIWYRYGGKQLGYTGNNGNLDTDYLTSIDNRMRTPPANPNAFLFGSAASVSHADFSQALDPINSYGQGSDAGSYTVRAGDTLQSIARNLWGDSSLWYKLAQANGLSGPGAPGEGRSLIVPSGVMSNAHNESTFRPYDPARAIGDLSPTNPKPAKKAGGCGMIGAILLVVIAVAVSAVVAPWATGLIAGQGASVIGGIAAAALGGAIGGAAGAIASQAVGLATGLQSKFDWKGVALGALGGAIGGGLGKFGALAEAGKLGSKFGALSRIGNLLNGSGFVGGAARGVVSSALTQGIGVATGLQDKFSWSGVAGAALGGGASNWVSGQLGPLARTGFDGHMVGALSSAASALANAGARTLIDGTDFGDNLIAALPDVIGSTIGNMIAGGVMGSGSRGLAEKAEGIVAAKDAEADRIIAEKQARAAGIIAAKELEGARILGQKLSMMPQPPARLALAGVRLPSILGGGLMSDASPGLNGSLLVGLQGVAGAASRAGDPPDPYSEANLDLGVNAQFTDEILIAARQSHLPPHTVAAIISAEAAKFRDGRWDPNSYNTGSKAAGLTQFLESTWIGEANGQGTYLNRVARHLGWLDSNDHLVGARRQDFLNLRFNAQHSISAAADYAARNLASLDRDGLILDHSPGALARYAYIAHHEGLGGARAFLRGTLRVSDTAWTLNVPKSARQVYLRANGNNRNLAYRAYMTRYTDQNIDVRRYMIDPQGVTVPPTRSLYR